MCQRLPSRGEISLEGFGSECLLSVTLPLLTQEKSQRQLFVFKLLLLLFSKIIHLKHGETDVAMFLTGLFNMSRH